MNRKLDSVRGKWNSGRQCYLFGPDDPGPVCDAEGRCLTPALARCDSISGALWNPARDSYHFDKGRTAQGETEAPPTLKRKKYSLRKHRHQDAGQYGIRTDTTTSSLPEQ